MMFKKILVPIDGSKGADRALAAAIALAKEAKSSLLVLHVLEIGTLALIEKDPVKAMVGFLSDTMIQLNKKGKDVLQKAKKQLRGADFEERVELGNPAKTICKTANEESCDLIVIGSRGLSDLKGLLLGSVSHAVLQRSHCPVLLVK